MEKKKTILLDEYLESVSGMHEAETDPFFYTRLKAAMEKKEDWRFPLRPSWIIAGLAVLLVLNGFMALNNNASTIEQSNPSSSSLQSFATAYDLTIQSTY